MLGAERRRARRPDKAAVRRRGVGRPRGKVHLEFVRAVGNGRVMLITRVRGQRARVASGGLPGGEVPAFSVISSRTARSSW